MRLKSGCGHEGTGCRQNVYSSSVCHGVITSTASVATRTAQMIVMMHRRLSGLALQPHWCKASTTGMVASAGDQRIHKRSSSLCSQSAATSSGPRGSGGGGGMSSAGWHEEGGRGRGKGRGYPGAGGGREGAGGHSGGGGRGGGGRGPILCPEERPGPYWILSGGKGQSGWHACDGDQVNRCLHKGVIWNSGRWDRRP